MKMCKISWLLVKEGQQGFTRGEDSYPLNPNSPFPSVSSWCCATSFGFVGCSQFVVNLAEGTPVVFWVHHTVATIVPWLSLLVVRLPFFSVGPVVCASSQIISELRLYFSAQSLIAIPIWFSITTRQVSASLPPLLATDCAPEMCLIRITEWHGHIVMAMILSWRVPSNLHMNGAWPSWRPCHTMPHCSPPLMIIN